jgi:lipopolysaccharide export system protein LptA
MSEHPFHQSPFSGRLRDHATVLSTIDPDRPLDDLEPLRDLSTDAGSDLSQDGSSLPLFGGGSSFLHCAIYFAWRMFVPVAVACRRLIAVESLLMPVRRFPLFVSFVLLPIAAGTLHAQDVGPSAPIIVEHADSLLGYMEGGQEVNEFIGHVQGMQGVVSLRADKVVLYRAANRAILTGNIVVKQPGMIMTAPRADYDGLGRVATAPDGLTLQEDSAILRAGSGSYRMYERIAYFSNGVTLDDGKAKLRAGAGEYYSLERRAIFREGVNIVSDSGTINARQLTYWRDSEEAFATGSVVLVPKGENARLSGDTLHNIPARSYTLVTGHPKLMQIDTSSSGDSVGTIRRDTTVITARKMEAFRGTDEEYKATDSVRLLRGKLEAVSRLARFLPKEEVIALGSGVKRRSRDTTGTRSDSGGRDTSAVTGFRDGTGSATASGDSTPSGSVPTPIVWYDKSQLTGDTITVGLKERKLRTIDVDGNAFAVTEGDRPARYDQLAGARLFFDVLADTIRNVRSEGSASSIYFLSESGQPNGVNRASGDTIKIAFASGQVSRINVRGRRLRAEGEYFPEGLVAGQETGYRLEGFRWISRAGSEGTGSVKPVVPQTSSSPPPQEKPKKNTKNVPARRVP